MYKYLVLKQPFIIQDNTITVQSIDHKLDHE